MLIGRIRDCSSLIQPLLPELNATWMVHVEQSCRRSANRRKPDDSSLREVKMVGPYVNPRVEDIDFVTGLWVDAREIGPLEGVASVACLSKPTQVIVHVFQVLLGNDVLDMKWDERRCLLRHAAVFTQVTGSLPYQVTRGSIHL